MFLRLMLFINKIDEKSYTRSVSLIQRNRRQEGFSSSSSRIVLIEHIWEIWLMLQIWLRVEGREAGRGGRERPRDREREREKSV